MRVRDRVVTLLFLFFSVPLAAQSSGGASRFGVLGGVNSATFGGSDAEDVDRLTTFVIGGYVVKPFTGGLSFRPELLYARKGTESSLSDADVSAKISVKLAYIDVPLLLQLEQRAENGVSPHGYVGPYVGVKLSCKVGASGGGVSVDADCDDEVDSVKSVDFGGVIGAGIGFPLAQLRGTLGARYAHGFADLSSDAKVQNRVLSFYVGLEFGKR